MKTGKDRRQVRRWRSVPQLSWLEEISGKLAKIYVQKFTDLFDTRSKHRKRKFARGRIQPLDSLSQMSMEGNRLMATDESAKGDKVSIPTPDTGRI